MIDALIRRRPAPWRHRTPGPATASRVLDLGDGWELLAGRDGRPYLRGPDSRLREVGLSPAPPAEWLLIVREQLAGELPPTTRAALEHARLRWGG